MRFSLKFYTIFLLSIILSSLASISLLTKVEASLGEWSTPRHSLRLLGSSIGSAPHTNRVAYRIPLSNALAKFPSLSAAAEGLLFLLGHDSTTGSLTGVYALDAMTGNTVWSHSYPSETPPNTAWSTSVVFSNGRLFNSWWSSTCSSWSQQGYVCNQWSYQSHVYAYNASTGTVLWTNTIGLEMRDLVVSNGIVYVSDIANVRALNSTSGSLLWTMSYSSSNYSVGGLTIADGILSVGPAGTYPYHFYALDPSTGAILWDYSSILQRNGYPYGVYSGFKPPAGGGQIFLEYDQGGSNPGIVAFNTTSQLPMWNSTTATYAAVLQGNLLYATGSTLTDPNHIYALNRTTGAVLWKTDVPGEYWGIYAYVDGLLFLSNGFALYALNATNGQTIWSYSGLSYGSISLYSGKLYSSSGGEIVVFGDGPGSPDFIVELPPRVLYPVHYRGSPDCSRPIMADFAVNSQNGFTGNITLSVTNLPSPADGTWSVNPVNVISNQEQVSTLSISQGTLCGSYDIYSLNLNASGGGVAHTYTFKFVFRAGVPVFQPLTIALFLLVPIVVKVRQMKSRISRNRVRVTSQ